MIMDVDLDGLFAHNTTYDYEDYEYKEDFESKGSIAVLIPVLYSAELVIGLLGNGLLLAILVQKRRSWSASDTVILYLSVADVLLLLTLPLWAAQAAQSCGWCFGVILCKISRAVFNLNYYCGILLLICISLDHYQSITHATQQYAQKTPRLAHIKCLLVWLTSLLLVIPDFIFMVVVKDPAQEKALLCFDSFSLVGRLLHHTLGFLLPTAALIICCSRILLRSKGLQKERSTIFILLLVVVFFLCWTPYNITLIVDTLRNRSQELGDPLKTPLMVTSALGCFHACLRPLLYVGLCGNFRKHTLAMLRCATVESESSLWELGVANEAPPDQSHEREELKQMTSVDHQVQSTQC
ncbi:C-X-C chemokine receptor type 3-like [Pempheris klunzingeri]|uniref:C-X-C chemokine receptor type 3-like n=1 Tax=Pempheris klunzingeri TaxID=3127111 RepID=UPI0039813734